MMMIIVVVVIIIITIVPLCTSGCAGTHYVNQAGLEITKILTRLSLLNAGTKGIYTWKEKIFLYLI